MMILAVLSCLTAAAWAPLALRFKRTWSAHHNPVSIATAGVLMFLSYEEIMFVLAETEETSWKFFAIATHLMAVAVMINMYLAFRWAASHDNGAHPPDA